MQRLLSYLNQWLPKRFKGRRFLLDQYHFDLTSFDGDVGDWLVSFPISNGNVEIYFALAELFRRRGEFDKAVSIHEAIANAPVTNLSDSEISLEIAQDYYAAGILSHAEDVLIKALEQANEDISRQAFRLWLAILESEQDWSRAVSLVEQYGIPGSGGLRLANLYCEHVEQLRREKPSSYLQKVLKKALKLGVSARAELLNAELATEQNNLTAAIQSYRDILQRDPRRVNLVLRPLLHLTLMNNSTEPLLRFLNQLYLRHPSVRLLEVLIELYQKSSLALPGYLEKTIETQVKRADSSIVLHYWLQQQDESIREVIKPIVSAFDNQSLSKTDDHLCVECGFHSEKMVWQCPQCSTWETLFSRYELKIDQQLKKVT